MGWWSATWRSVLIFGYVAVFTVWLPDRLLRVGAIASANVWVRDGIALGVWGGALLAGLAALRAAQHRELI